MLTEDLVRHLGYLGIVLLGPIAMVVAWLYVRRNEAREQLRG